MVYALLGIPLTFLYLSSIGNFLANCFKLFYKRVCCDVLCCEKCERKRKRQRLKQRRRREIVAAAAHQRNFRFGDELGDGVMDVEESGRNLGFVESPDVGDGSLAPPRLRGSSSSWTTVSTTSAEGEAGAVKDAAASGAVSAARETDILGDDTTATSDDERATTCDGPAVRETAIIDDDADEDTTGSRQHRLPVSTTARQPASRRHRLRRSQSDTKLDTTATENDANRYLKATSTNQPAAETEATAADYDVMRRSASVKARAAGSIR